MAARGCIISARTWSRTASWWGWTTPTPGFRYALSRWTALTRYCDDGRLAIDNNTAERAIKPVVLGRKNWLFAGSDAGGTRAGAIASLLETARMNGIDPHAWLRHVLEVIADYPARCVAELLPRAVPNLATRLNQRASC